MRKVQIFLPSKKAENSFDFSPISSPPCSEGQKKGKIVGSRSHLIAQIYYSKRKPNFPNRRSLWIYKKSFLFSDARTDRPRISRLPLFYPQSQSLPFPLDQKGKKSQCRHLVKRPNLFFLSLVDSRSIPRKKRGAKKRQIKKSGDDEGAGGKSRHSLRQQQLNVKTMYFQHDFGIFGDRSFFWKKKFPSPPLPDKSNYAARPYYAQYERSTHLQQCTHHVCTLCLRREG